MIGSYVDDSLCAVSPDFEDHLNKLREKFDAKPLQWNNADFLALQVLTKVAKDGSRLLETSQPQHLEKLKPIDEGTTFEQFQSVRAAVAWIAHTRPDLYCSINLAAQVTNKTFGKSCVTELNKAINHCLATRSVSLQYGTLQEGSLHIRAYADAPFATNDDKTSQIGYVILLCDKSNRCHVLAYKRRKSRRVVRSIMAGETYAFSDAFDQAYVMKRDLEALYDKNMPLMMFTDSKQLFDVLTKASYPTEKRLMIDIASVRESYNTFEISNKGS